MVVVIEARVGELLGLVRLQHAQSHARFHAHAAHALDHRDDRAHVAVLGVAPRRAHAEAGRAIVLGLRRRLQTARTSISLVALTPLSALTDCEQ